MMPISGINSKTTLRWIAVLPGAVGAYILVNLIAACVLAFLGLPLWLTKLMGSITAPASYVIIGARIAPKYKYNTAVILTLLLVLPFLGGIALLIYSICFSGDIDVAPLKDHTERVNSVWEVVQWGVCLLSAVLACREVKKIEGDNVQSINFKKFMTTRNLLITASIIAGIFCLIAAAGSYPYHFYTLTRWVVFLVCAFGFFNTLDKSPSGLKVGFAIVGILFNPLIPFHLKRDTWQILNVFAGVALIWMPFQAKRTNSDH
jgi:hypothetical protein